HRREKAKRKRAKFFQHQKNIRENFLHQISAALIALCAVIGTEALDLENLLKKEGGKEGLHREILSTGCGMFLRMVSYKAGCTPRRSWGSLSGTPYQRNRSLPTMPSMLEKRREIARPEVAPM